MDDQPLVETWPLRVFGEVATTGSMTLAAARLGVTQSAVSQAVRRLEAVLGTALVRRGSRPVALTPAGVVLAAEAGPILRLAERLPALLRAGEGTREVRLGLVDSFASTAGPELVRRLSRGAGRVVLWSGLAPSLGAALLDREVDAIVTSDPLEDLDGLTRVALWKEPFVLLLPRGMAEAADASLARLADAAPLIRFSARSHTGMQVERHLRRLGMAPERRIEVDGSDALLAMVAAGIGWAIATPLCLLQGGAHLEGTLPRPLPPPGFNRTLSLVVRADAPPALVAALAAEATAALRESCLPRLRRLAPALAPLVTIGADAPEATIGADAPWITIGADGPSDGVTP